MLLSRGVEASWEDVPLLPHWPAWMVMISLEVSKHDTRSPIGLTTGFSPGHRQSSRSVYCSSKDRATERGADAKYYVSTVMVGWNSNAN